MFDVIIAGAGPAGMNAALVLGRARRRVLVCDTDHPRSASSPAVDGFLSRDGISPEELRRVGREQLRPYETVELRSVEVIDATRDGDGFAVTPADGARERGRFLILATGVVDELPPIPGLRERWGTAVMQARTATAGKSATSRSQSSGREPGRCTGHPCCEGGAATSCSAPTGRPALATRSGNAWLSAISPVREERIERVERTPGGPVRIVSMNGEPLVRRGIFLHAAQSQHSPLVERLGFTFTEQGTSVTDEGGFTGIPGLYAAGDMRRLKQQAILAAADGAPAARATNTELAGIVD